MKAIKADANQQLLKVFEKSKIVFEILGQQLEIPELKTYAVNNSPLITNIIIELALGNGDFPLIEGQYSYSVSYLKKFISEYKS